ncbi:pyrroline-5-carboxylate reductase family protein [Candidatus Omnitrophota bacterium]
MNNVGILGFGNMGRAISESIKNNYGVFAFDKEKDKTRNVSGVKIALDVETLVAESEAIILAVKPQDFDDLLAILKNAKQIDKKLIISIAAGITTTYIGTYLGSARVVRVMPNLPIKVNKGISCICKGAQATDDDLDFTKGIFANLGETLALDEAMMDAATAISGSGPGYFCEVVKDKNNAEIKQYAIEVFIPQLVEAAGSVGFDPKQASLLAETTTHGTIALLNQERLSAEELKQRVASKGGTTEAALEILSGGGNLKDAVKAALKRAQELSRR